MSNDEAGFEGEFEARLFDDIREWLDRMKLVHAAVEALRNARAGEDVEAATTKLVQACSRARDSESYAIHVMNRFGYADGVNVPGSGRFLVHRLEDGTEVLVEAASVSSEG